MSWLFTYRGKLCTTSRGGLWYCECKAKCVPKPSGCAASSILTRGGRHQNHPAQPGCCSKRRQRTIPSHQTQMCLPLWSVNTTISARLPTSSLVQEVWSITYRKCMKHYLQEVYEALPTGSVWSITYRKCMKHYLQEVYEALPTGSVWSITYRKCMKHYLQEVYEVLPTGSVWSITYRKCMKHYLQEVYEALPTGSVWSDTYTTHTHCPYPWFFQIGSLYIIARLPCLTAADQTSKFAGKGPSCQQALNTTSDKSVSVFVAFGATTKLNTSNRTYWGIRISQLYVANTITDVAKLRGN